MFLDWQVWANSVEPDHTAPEGSIKYVYKECPSVCIFWMHYSMVKTTLFKFKHYYKKFLKYYSMFYVNLMTAVSKNQI